RRVGLGLGQLRAQAGDHPRSGLTLHRAPRGAAAQLERDRERALALAGRTCELVLDCATPVEQVVERRLRRIATNPLRSDDANERLPSALCPRLALDRGHAGGLGSLVRDALEPPDLEARVAGV